MRITPIEIRQRQFEKKFRGFDIDEVSAYLNTLSNEWERLVDENKELKKRFEAAEKEVAKLREVENTLYKTLKTAEDTGNNIIDQANKKAELLIKEAQNTLINAQRESQEKAQKLKEDATLNAKNIIDSAKDELRAAEKEIKEIENKKLAIIEDLKMMASDINQKIERYSQPVKIDLYNKFDQAETEVKDETVEVSEIFEDIVNKEVEIKTVDIDDKTEKVDAPKIDLPELPELTIDPNKGSFFDQI